MIKIISKGRFSSLSEFTIIEDKKIGCGSFGTVKLARHNSTCCIYAIKIICLKDVPSITEIKLVQREIKMHSELDHPHIVKLWDTMLEQDTIYMIMDYAECGNLFYYQNTKNIFAQAEAFKFFCQTLNGVKYLHDNDIIHRDLKPENLLLDSLNNIKICDFGWCAEDIKFKRTTFCGTYEYMAPEMLFQSQYDYRVDIWALGVLLFELLHGSAPYKGKDAMEVQQQMLKGGYNLSKDLSESARDLIEKILQFQPDKRLSIAEIYNHPWVLQMQGKLTTYLSDQKVNKPQQIHSKIVSMPSTCATKTPQKLKTLITKHRKNNSLNLQQIGRHININLQINNYGIQKKSQTRKHNIYHSLQKQLQEDKLFRSNNQPFQKSQAQEQYSQFNNFQESYNELYHGKSSAICKTLSNQKELDKVLERGKLKPKLSKEFERSKNHEANGINPHAKKKYRYRKSQQALYEEKPVRYNTQAPSDEQLDPGRIKKQTGQYAKPKLLKILSSCKNLLKPKNSS